MLDTYVQTLRDKFPSCEIDRFRSPFFSDATCIVVGSRNGEKWFEKPILISKDITPELWDDGRGEIARWEEEIEQELIRIKT